jgi:hypothetical protein
MNLRRLHIPVRPAQFETPAWYLKRLCTANAVDPVWIFSVVRARGRTAGNRAELGSAIAELGGPGTGHWTASHARANLGRETLKGPYDRQHNSRLACLSCTAGVTVATYDHIRFGLCLKHDRWIGPGTTTGTQRIGVIDREMHTAERTVRRLVSRGQVRHDFYVTAWEVTRDWAYRSGQRSSRLRCAIERHDFTREVDDRIALYPETVRLLEVVSRPHFAELVDAGLGGGTARREYLHDALDWLPADRWLVVEGVEQWAAQRSAQSNSRCLERSVA